MGPKRITFVFFQILESLQNETNWMSVANFRAATLMLTACVINDPCNQRSRTKYLEQSKEIQ